MYIKTVIKPAAELELIRIDDTVGSALKIIDEKDLLSLPVISGKKFIGMLSKRYVYQTFFEMDESKEVFLQRPVSDFMRTKIPTLGDTDIVEDAIGFFIRSPYPFIPVVDENEDFVGIITRKAVMERYEQIFKSEYPRFFIYSYDYKGKMGKIVDIINRYGGDIKNLALMDTGVLGLKEIFLSVESDQLDKIIESLKSHNFDVKM